MTIKIEGKITGVAVKSLTSEPSAAAIPDKPKTIKRAFVLTGKTYRLKPPYEEHALYVTINDVIIDTKQYPFEIFFNSKDPANLQWVSALTLLISMEFKRCIQHNESLSHFLDKLAGTYSPMGGYRPKSRNGKKPKYAHSIVSEIAEVIRDHAEEENKVQEVEAGYKEVERTLPPCPKCKEPSLRFEGGCEVCSSCDYSACG